MTLADAMNRGRSDAKRDWSYDKIQEEFDESSLTAKVYMEAYCEEIKRLSLLPENKG